MSKTGFHRISFPFPFFFFLPFFPTDSFHDSLCRRFILLLFRGRESFLSTKVLTTTFLMVQHGQALRYSSSSLLQRGLLLGAENPVHCLFLQARRELVCPGEEERVKNYIILEKVRLERASGVFLMWPLLESRALDCIFQLAKHHGSLPCYTLSHVPTYV